MPITVQLAARLREAARARPDHAPLLLQGDGTPWGDNPGAGYHREVKQIVSAIGADPDATMYALRHSSIVRMLKANATWVSSFQLAGFAQSSVAAWQWTAQSVASSDAGLAVLFLKSKYDTVTVPSSAT